MEGTIGEIRMFAGSFPPSNWAFCDGRQLRVADYPALNKVIGTLYGGDSNEFYLPDLRAKFPIGPGAGIYLGTTGGANMVDIKLNNLPPHNHSFTLKADSLTASAVTTIYLAEHDADGSLDGNGKLISKGIAGGDVYTPDTGTRVALSPKSANTTVNVTMTPQSVVTNIIGSGDKLNITPPYQAINFIICLIGDFPSDPRRRILGPDMKYDTKSFKIFTQNIQIGNSSGKKKIVRVNNPFYNSGYIIQPTIQIMNSENYSDVFATSVMGEFDAEYFEVAICRIDGDSWAQNLYMTVNFNFYQQ